MHICTAAAAFKTTGDCWLYSAVVVLKSCLVFRIAHSCIWKVMVWWEGVWGTSFPVQLYFFTFNYGGRVTHARVNLFGRVRGYKSEYEKIYRAWLQRHSHRGRRRRWKEWVNERSWNGQKYVFWVMAFTCAWLLSTGVEIFSVAK